ncbi:MAG: cation:proton antiporter [Elusimicrobia bacterium]|nr:cation:proton antiporter [Elusimicrobiota bacterium]
METAIVLSFVGLLVFLAHFFSGLFEKTRVPDVLPLVLLGVLLGPVFHVLTPESLGKVGRIFATVTLVIILFEGGLNFSFTTLLKSLARGAWLTVVSFLVTMVAVGTAAALALHMPVLEAFMLGSILGGTSTAVVVPLVGRLRLQERTRIILILESTLNDVLCIVGTLFFIHTSKMQALSFGQTLGQAASAFLMAALFGSGAAFFWSNALARIRRIENSTFTTPAFVFIIYGLTEILGYSGAIAALSFGVTLGNVRSLEGLTFKKWSFFRPIHLNDNERAFFAEIVFLIRTFFFVYIGLNMRLANMALVTAGLGLTLLVFALRGLSVRMSFDKTFPRFDSTIASVMMPKGLAAAVLATLPIESGIASGPLIQNMVYTVILFSIFITAILTFLVEKNILRQPYALLFSRYADSAPQAQGAEPASPPRAA